MLEDDERAKLEQKEKEGISEAQKQAKEDVEAERNLMAIYAGTRTANHMMPAGAPGNSDKGNKAGGKKDKKAKKGKK